MIDDKQTCDVCGEEFNEDRPHHDHDAKHVKVSAEPIACEVCKPQPLDGSGKDSRPFQKGV